MSKNQIRIRILSRVEEAFKLDDERLRLLVEAAIPGVKIEQANREELLLLVVKWAVEDATR